MLFLCYTSLPTSSPLSLGEKQDKEKEMTGMLYKKKFVAPNTRWTGQEWINAIYMNMSGRFNRNISRNKRWKWERICSEYRIQLIPIWLLQGWLAKANGKIPTHFSRLWTGLFFQSKKSLKYSGDRALRRTWDVASKARIWPELFHTSGIGCILVCFEFGKQDSGWIKFSRSYDYSPPNWSLASYNDTAYIPQPHLVLVCWLTKRCFAEAMVPVMRNKAASLVHDYADNKWAPKRPFIWR